MSVPVNACGNDVSVVGILDSASGNTCVNGGTPTAPGHPTPPPCGCHPTTPPKTTPPTTTKPSHPARRTTGPASSHPTWVASGKLAETGSGASHVVAPLGASVLGGSGLLLRKRVASLRHQTHRQH